MVVASSDGLFLGARAVIKCDSVTSILQMASSEHFVNLPQVKISFIERKRCFASDTEGQTIKI